MAEAGPAHAQSPQPAGAASMLGVQAGDDFWLVDMTDISEILPLPELTPVPLAKPWYRGIANIRGSLYGINDLAAFRGQPLIPRSTHNRILLLNAKFAFNAGLLVTRVFGLRDTAGWQREPAVASECYRDEQERVWCRLEIGALLQRAEFLQIENGHGRGAE